MTPRTVSRLVPVMMAGAVLCSVPLGSDPSAAGQPAFKLLYGFENPPAEPRAEVMEGSDGALYGTTWTGGLYGSGILFKVNKDGTGFLKLHDFDRADRANGSAPEAGVVEGSDGALYGTTYSGGTRSSGTVFKIDTDGSSFQVLHDFSYYDPSNGGNPLAGLVEGSDGALYGTTVAGGAYRSGVVFKINKDGTGFGKLHDFNDADTADGAHPENGLLEASDGTLYGSATQGGLYDSGVVFKLNRDGTGFLKLHDFNRADKANGAGPHGELTEGSDGTLYGTTFGGGTYDWGVVFRIKKDGAGFLKLHDFNLSDGGGGPDAGVTEGSDGALYGTMVFGGVFKLNKDGSGFRELYALDGEDGYAPHAGLVEGSDGMLYGTTAGGGTYSWGVVFKVSKEGSGFHRLYDFSPSVGAFPRAKLVIGAEGAVYGTTYRGGAHGVGIVFKVSRSVLGFPTLRTLHHFDRANGATPYAGLIQGSDGALYGTTFTGGQTNAGVLFKIEKDGTGFVKLHDFGGSNGSFPYGGVVEGADGALYGTASGGGALGGGTVFKVNKDGSGFVKLHDLGGSDGRIPYGGIVEGSDGALYGTTLYGGVHDSGVIFTVNKEGNGFLKLHDFNRTDPADGTNPYAGLVKGSDGALYGTTYSGGVRNNGIVFKVNRDGTGFFKLHDFLGGDGALARAGLVEGSDGALYGTTVAGGARGLGTIFKIEKDGTGFLMLHGFSGSDGANPYAGVVQGPKGALYGTASGGGPKVGGGVFAFLP